MNNYIISILDENLLIFLKTFLKEIETLNNSNLYLNGFYNFKKYYSDMIDPFAPKTQMFLYRYVKRLLPVINIIKSLNHSPKILDAGCGFGTESIMFALLGAEVISYDLDSQRIKFAKDRVKFYELQFKRPLNIKFNNSNILSSLSSIENEFDIVFTMEAISHIDPAEDFFKLVNKILKSDGFFVIGETNPMNIFSKLHFFIEHTKLGRKTTKVDPCTRKVVTYAIEREFYIERLRRILNNIGFEILMIEYVGFISGFRHIPKFLSGLLLPVIFAFENIFEKIPLLKSFAQTYTLICKKRNI